MYGRETFGVRVAGDGMAPRIADGDYVYVDPDEPAVHGSVVLFGYGAHAVLRALRSEGTAMATRRRTARSQTPKSRPKGSGC